MLLEVQCEVSTVSDDLGSHVICWCWSTVFSEVHSQRSHLPGNFRALQVQVLVQVELCHSATCGDIQWNEMSCLTGPRCYINTDIQQ